MTTITIESNPDLPKHHFNNMEELILAYFQNMDMVLLEEVHISDLPDNVQFDLKNSIQQGKDELIDFQG